MLNRTFIHVPGIGPVTEQGIWERGLHSWSQFLADPAAAGLPPARTEHVRHIVAESSDCLARRDHRYFARSLASREQWRAFPDFERDVAYLDIETTGMAEEDDITIIGVYDGEEVRVYTKGEDLEDFAADIRDYKLLVTFFGSGFDLPFLRRRFPHVSFDHLHIDLCWTLRRLGHTGGLKHIERKLGLQRSPETVGLDGWDAVRLWREWERGSQEALNLLKAYNREDIVNLKWLVQYAYDELRVRTGIP
ncbi:MAG: ribonuclease H-like domain-containing protein [Armatimonadetes bacterium]|nr:ribonuclease H-like domain-containing protein [Armatimonadota bacterium]